MIENVLTIIVVILILNVLFFVHELGHVAVATLLGMKTEVIGLGLPIGKALKFQFKNIEYRVHGLLFGAYAIIPELSPYGSEDQSHNRSPLTILKRILVVLGGPAAFLVAAWLVILFAFSIFGVPNKSVCVEQLPEANPIARNAGVRVGDKITAVDGVPITSVEQLIAYLTAHRLTPVTISVLNESKSRDLPMVPNDKGKVGMGLSTKIESYERTSTLGTLSRSVSYQFEILNMLWPALQQYFVLKMSPSPIDGGGTMGRQAERASEFGGASRASDDAMVINGIPGVVTFGRAIYEVNQDLRLMPYFVQLVLLDVAILSLLPFPGTDGGHLIGVLFTSLRKEPLKKRKSFRIVRILALVYMGVSGCPLCLLSGWRSTPDSSDKTDSRY